MNLVKILTIGLVLVTSMFCMSPKWKVVELLYVGCIVDKTTGKPLHCFKRPVFKKLSECTKAINQSYLDNIKIELDFVCVKSEISTRAK